MDHFVCTQLLQSIIRMELFPPSFQQTEPENSEVFIDTVLSPVQKAFVCFTFTVKPFFHCIYLISTNTHILIFVRQYALFSF